MLRRGLVLTFTRASVLLALVGAPACTSTTPSDVAIASGARVAPERVDIGDLACGEARAVTLSLENGSDEPLEWRAIVEPALALTLRVDHGTLAARETGRTELTASIPPGLVRPGQAVMGVIRVHLSGREERDVNVPVAFVAHGAWIESPTAVDFGVLPFDRASASRTLTLRNTGDRTAAFLAPRLATGAFGFSTNASPLVVAPGASTNLDVSFAPSLAGAQRVDVVLDADGPLCSPSPVRAPVIASVTGGPLGLSTTTLDFGDLDCGEDVGPLAVRLENRSAAATPWTAVIDAAQASDFELRSPSSGTLDAGHDVEVIVGAKHGAHVAGPTFGTLTITAGVAPFQVNLAQNRLGAAIRVLGGNDVALGRRKVGASTAFAVTLVNDGTSPATVIGTDTSDATFSLPITVPAHGSASLSGTYTARARGDLNTAVALTSSDALCAPLPALALKSFGYARGTSAWNPSCVLGDDGTGYCGDRTIGRVPVGATLFSGSAQEAGSYAAPCFIPANSDVPSCWGETRGFDPRPSSRGLKQTLGAYAVKADGSVIRLSDGAALGLKDIVRLAYADTSDYCVIDTAGVVSCWGNSRVIAGLTGSWQFVPDTSPYVVPGISGARAMAVAGYVDESLCIAESTGTVRCWDEYLTSAGRVVPGPTDVVQLFSGRSRMCALTGAGILWCAERAEESWEVVPLTGVKDVVAGVSRVILTDGRMFDLMNDAISHVQEFE